MPSGKVFVTFTGTLTSRVSSSVPQSSTVGVPTRLPFSSTLKPFVGVELITASDLFVSTTFVSAGTAWPSGTVTGVAVAVRGSIAITAVNESIATAPL